jgi:hypothetical protein
MSVKSYGLPAVALIAILSGALSTPLGQNHVLGQQTAQKGDTKSKPLAQQLIGTWKLEKASTPGSPSGVGTRLKLFTGTHWCVIQPDAQTGVILFQHGGRYELSGDTMKTTCDFAGESTRAMINRTEKLTITVDGDTMKQVDTEGVFNETWKRVK